MHRLLLHNGKIVPNMELTLSAGQVGLLNGWGVFSTIRVFEGVLFAFERHWARMMKDARLMHVPMPDDPDAFRGDLLRLVEANQAPNATLRVAVIRNRGGYFEGDDISRDFDVIAFTADVKGWGRAVRLGVQEQARHSGCEFAGAKILSWAQNLTWLERAQQQGYDEVVLLDEQGRVSECTSANIFVEKGGEVLTPGLSSGCLPGVTREILLKDARDTRFPVREADLTLDDVYAADAVFITSTTRHLLSVESVAGRAVSQSGGARAALSAAFSAFVDQYVAGARSR